MAFYTLLRSLYLYHHPIFFRIYCLRPQGRNNLLSPLSSQRPALGMPLAPINVDDVWKKGGLELVSPNTTVRASAARGHQDPGRAGRDKQPQNGALRARSVFWPAPPAAFSDLPPPGALLSQPRRRGPRGKQPELPRKKGLYWGVRVAEAETLVL